VVLCAVLCAARGGVARAQSSGPADCQVLRSNSPAAPRWSPPLDRMVSVQSATGTLGSVLDQIAQAASLRLSYSADLLPLDRAVCLLADSVPAGTVLARVLDGTGVGAVAVGGDQVALAPGSPPADVEPRMAGSIGVLDRVIVTGAGGAMPQRESTTGVDVLTGAQLARENTADLSSALDGLVPGMWSWGQAPTSLVTSYASVRGASSFQLTYPKIYIDGIEVANPLLVARFAPDAIDRIEVIRGPEGSALYGSDAISGVINIRTRYQGTDSDGTHTAIRSTAGVTQSDYSHGVLSQDHSMSYAAGSSTQSVDVHVSANSLGDYVPNGYSRELLASSNGRVVGERTSFSGIARVLVEDAGVPVNPLLPAQRSLAAGSEPFGAAASSPPASTAPQSAREYTIGGTAAFAPDDRWTHTFVAGVDGYRLANVQTNITPIMSLVDSALHAAQGGADRVTLRATSVARFGADDATHGTLTFAAEQATLRENTLGTPPLAPNGRDGITRGSAPTLVAWENSTGLTSQGDLALNDNLFLTGGVRVERDSRLSDADDIALLPMLGVAEVRDYGPLSVKVRAAYGEGVRPPSTETRLSMMQGTVAAATQPSLGPERQSGTETGLEVTVHRLLSLQATRFDQRASGLIQQVALPGDSAARRMDYALEDVGQISNRGWEFEVSTAVSRLTVASTLSLVDSRVDHLATGYTGDLEPGDRMLDVPARTASVNATWTASRWFLSMTGARAMDWINYDQLALAQAWLGGTSAARDFAGAALRSYWRRYNGGLRLRTTASRQVGQSLSLEFVADNLLNYQRGEPDDVTLTPGRTLMTGLRVKF
jgi:iron complex outermembrane receptor protein